MWVYVDRIDDHNGIEPAMQSILLIESQLGNYATIKKEENENTSMDWVTDPPAIYCTSIQLVLEACCMLMTASIPSRLYVTNTSSSHCQDLTLPRMTCLVLHSQCLSQVFAILYYMLEYNTVHG